MIAFRTSAPSCGLQLPAAAPRRPVPSAATPGMQPTTLMTAQPAALAAITLQKQPWRSRGRQPAPAAAAAAPAAAAAAPPAAAAAAQAFLPALVQAWNTNPAAVLLAAAACILGVALSVFLLASIPTILALRRSAIAAESLLLAVTAEVPDTAATMRLSGMELADCIQEVGALSTDLTEGVRASARAVASAEAGIRQGAELAGRAVTQHVIPQVQDRVETALQERARLEYTREVLASTKTAAQRLRFALAASGLARGVLQSTRYLRRPSGGGRRGGSGGRDEELLGA